MKQTSVFPRTTTVASSTAVLGCFVLSIARLQLAMAVDVNMHGSKVEVFNVLQICDPHISSANKLLFPDTVYLRPRSSAWRAEMLKQVDRNFRKQCVVFHPDSGHAHASAAAFMCLTEAKLDLKWCIHTGKRNSQSRHSSHSQEREQEAKYHSVKNEHDIVLKFLHDVCCCMKFLLRVCLTLAMFMGAICLLCTALKLLDMLIIATFSLSKFLLRGPDMLSLAISGRAGRWSIFLY
jgi:hypothetical protein